MASTSSNQSLKMTCAEYIKRWSSIHTVLSFVLQACSYIRLAGRRPTKLTVRLRRYIFYMRTNKAIEKRCAIVYEKHTNNSHVRGTGQVIRKPSYHAHFCAQQDANEDFLTPQRHVPSHTDTHTRRDEHETCTHNPIFRRCSG